MLRCILLDDDLNGLEYLRLLCDRIAGVQVVRCFNDPLRFLNEEPALDYDVALLDIDMPGLNGLQVAERLQGRPVIFTTAHERFAADAFDREALDFIRKPITRERLERGLVKAREHLEHQTRSSGTITVMTDRGRTLVRTTDIRWVTTPEQEKRDKLMHLSTGLVLRLKTISLDQLLSLLPPHGFARPNRSDIVALNAVQLVAGGEVRLKPDPKDGTVEKRPLGAAYRDAFMAVMQG
ncbi:MAG: response regulator transcription factor [Flavobacteriales bacterium]|nr:response regulator transcription factor [Flavobacteriales bacterium]